MEQLELAVDRPRLAVACHPRLMVKPAYVQDPFQFAARHPFTEC